MNYLTSLLALFTVVQGDNPQQILGHHSRPRVAIIGGGAGGSSAAYHLQHYTGHAFDIDVFEANSFVGGRSTTVYPHENSSLEGIELGASIFIKENQILYSAFERYNLSRNEYSRDPEHGLDGSFTIYNGHELVYSDFQDSGLFGWWDKAKLLWKYSLSPIYATRLTKQYVSVFLDSFYGSSFPFGSLTALANSSGLADLTAQPGLSFLTSHGVGKDFALDIFQAVARGNYIQNLDKLHALASLVSYATEAEIYQVNGGNWRIFEEFLRESNATVHLNTTVDALKQHNAAARIGLGYKQLGKSDQLKDYDYVILAAPAYELQASISGFDSHFKPQTKVEYFALHVTLFTTKQARISPETINTTGPVPQSVYTTINNDNELYRGFELPFYSISIHKYLPETEEYVYKIFSSTKYDTEKIKSVFFESQPETEISWVYNKLWNAFPKLTPTDNFEDIRISPKLWYLNGIESFISTMETSALAGANVAGLIALESGLNTTEVVV